MKTVYVVVACSKLNNTYICGVYRSVKGAEKRQQELKDRKQWENVWIEHYMLHK